MGLIAKKGAIPSGEPPQNYWAASRSTFGAANSAKIVDGRVYAFGPARGSPTTVRGTSCIQFNNDTGAHISTHIQTPNDDVAHRSMGAVDSAGNFYLADYSTSNAAFTKYNSSAVQQWSRTTPHSQEQSQFILINSYDEIFTLNVRDDTYRSTRVRVLNTSGTELYKKALNLRIECCCLDKSDGGIILSGLVAASGSNTYIIKLSRTLSVVWARNYTNEMYTKQVTTDGSGNVYLTSDSGADTGATSVVKLNSSGVAQWARNYNRTNYGFSVAIGATEGGNLFYAPSRPGTDYNEKTEAPATSGGGSLLELDPSNGNVIWAREFLSVNTGAATGWLSIANCEIQFEGENTMFFASSRSSSYQAYPATTLYKLPTDGNFVQTMDLHYDYVVSSISWPTPTSLTTPSSTAQAPTESTPPSFVSGGNWGIQSFASSVVVDSIP